MLAAIHGQPEFLNLMFIEVVEFKNIHTQKLFVMLMPQLMQILKNVLDMNQERMRPIPAAMLLRVYFGQFFGFFLTEITMSKVAPAEFRDGAVDYFVNIFLHGVLRENNEAEAT